ncbi:hypothetical protein [Sporolactobacillus sp. KGMB 08714]|uniref:hypothetical protein n=1 Tax=Sporolactobacillus sp. KGMB 08714 TaxID=3064704 RepID=UPI002FBEAC68
MSGEFSFGIYPLSAAGTPFGLATGPADDYKKVKAALADLNNGTARLAPRVYLIYTPEWEKKMFALADRYRAAGLLGDLTIGCGNWTELQENFALEHWYAFIRKIIERYHASLCSLQITNEPNFVLYGRFKAVYSAGSYGGGPDCQTGVPKAGFFHSGRVRFGAGRPGSGTGLLESAVGGQSAISGCRRFCRA